MKHFLKSKLIWLLFISAIFFGIFYSKNFKKTQKFKIGEVLCEDFTQLVTIAGSVEPKRKTIISAPYDAYVKKLYVQLGNAVQAGDPIVSLAQGLRGPDDQLYPLRAPFPGIVVQILKTEGEYVRIQTESSLVRIDDLSQLFISANVPEIEVNKLKVNQEASVKVSAIIDRSYKGRIKYISLASKAQQDWNQALVEFKVLIEVLNPDSQIKPGMSAIIDVITKKLNKVLTLSHEFIEKDRDHYFVISEKGERKNIELGFQNEEKCEIKSGLVQAEKVRQIDFLSILEKK